MSESPSVTDPSPGPDPRGPAREDAALAARAGGGDRSAFRQIVLRHQSTVLALVRNVLGDATAAEDVAQDVFVAAWQHLPRFDPSRGRLLGWLARIARNRALNERARRRPQPVESVPERRVTAPVEDALVRAEVRERLDAALEALPLEQRLAFVLLHVHELSVAECAAIEGVPAGTIKSRASRARSRLRAVLSPEEVRP